MSYWGGNGGYRKARQNGGYRHGPGQGYRHGPAPDVASLPTTILGKTPTWRYGHGLDADPDTSTWDAADYGDDLTYTEGGTSPTFNDGSSFEALGANDSVTFTKGDYYQRVGDNTFGNLSNNDFWLKLIMRAGTSTSDVISKFLDGNNYWSCTFLNNATFQFNVKSTGTFSLSTGVGASATGTVYVYDIVWDDSGSARLYTDGLPTATASVSGVGALNFDIPFTVGARATDTIPTDCSVLYAALWEGAAWLSSHDQDTLVAQQYADLVG